MDGLSDAKISAAHSVDVRLRINGQDEWWCGESYIKGLIHEVAALRKSQAAYVAELRRADETIGALRKRVEELNRSNAAHRREHHAALDRAVKAEQRVEELEGQVEAYREADKLFAADFDAATLVSEGRALRERAEKAERERDEAIAALKSATLLADMAALQADLDAALHCLGATRLDRTRPGVEEAWAHIRPRLEKYWREERG